MSLKPVLYYTPRSPPCRAVLLTAAAVGVELDLRPMNLKDGEHMTPEFLKINPQHTIPVLDDNGVIVTDSHVICSYLADKYSTNDSLFPRDQQKRYEVQARLFFDCGHLFPRIRFLVEPIIYFGCTEMPPDKIAYIQKAYDGMDHCLSNGPFVCGTNMTIADLCCIASISTGREFAPIDAEKFPKLTAWVERMSKLPYYNKCNKDGSDILTKFVFEKLEENKKLKAA